MKSVFQPTLRAAALVLMGLLATLVQASPSVDFFRAVNIDRPRLVLDLIKQGVDPNALNEQGQSALYLALRDESPGVGEALLGLDAVNVNQRNAAGETALMMAALRRNLPAMQQLLKRGALVNLDGWTPLHYAATGGSAAAIELLLAQGAVLDARSPNGSTPLMMAARYGSEEAAALLLKRGAHAALRNDQGLNASDFARAAQRSNLAEQLDKAVASGP
jgi:uncharacterized protein